MKKILLMGLLAAGFLFSSCEKETKLGANLTWTDKDYFELNDGWKACIYEEAIGFTEASDYEIAALETKDVSVGDEAVIFNVSFSSVQNFTIAVFNDLNSNGQFDEGENAAVTFDTFDAGESVNVDLEVDY